MILPIIQGFNYSHYRDVPINQPVFGGMSLVGFVHCSAGARFTELPGKVSKHILDLCELFKRIFGIPYLGGGLKHFCYFHPYLGKIPILTNIFQMAWNHQLVMEMERDPIFVYRNIWYMFVEVHI